MAKLSDLSLEELYSRKATYKVVEAIRDKDTFSSINQRYCNLVCTIPEHEKDPSSVDLDIGSGLDILVISTCPPAEDKYRSGEAIHRQHVDVLTFMFKELGVSPVKWDHAFLSKCPRRGQKAKKRGVTAAKRCMPYLTHQIRVSKPRVIVATSGEVRAALGVKVTGKGRGMISFYEDHGVSIPVVSTIHPSVLSMIRQNSSGDMWGSEYYSILLRDLSKAKSIAEDGLASLPLGHKAVAMAAREEGKMIITRTLDEVRSECDKILSSVKLVSWDIESTGLDPWAPDARVLCMQFGYREGDVVKAVVIPLWHRGNTHYDPNQAWPFVRAILESDIVKVGHNMKFDLLYTAVTTGVRVVRAELDTMLLLHAMNSGVQGNYSLKTAVWDYLWDTGFGGYEDDLGDDEGEEEDSETTIEGGEESESSSA